MSGPASLVSCDWLKDQLDKGNPDNLVIVDVSWSSSKDCKDDYVKCHIPGAVFLNVLDAEHTDIHPRNIPTSKVFQKNVRSIGINKDSNVVVYSDSDKFGFFMSGRAWWTFRLFGHSNVSVLNGGLAKWKSCGYPTTDEIPVVKEGNFEAKFNAKYYRKFEDVSANLGTMDFQVCDTRPPASYSGTDTSGHIPGAINLHYGWLMDEEKMEMKPVEEIKEAFSAAGVDLNRPIATHCNSGMSSCSLALAAHLCGSDNFSVFHGGFTEWKAKAPADQIHK